MSVTTTSQGIPSARASRTCWKLREEREGALVVSNKPVAIPALVIDEPENRTAVCLVEHVAPQVLSQCGALTLPTAPECARVVTEPVSHSHALPPCPLSRRAAWAADKR